MRASERQFMLLRLILGADGIIQIRRAGLLDVVSKYVSDRFMGCIAYQTLDASPISGKVLDIQSSGIESIASQQDSGSSIIKRKANGIVPRNRDDLYDAIAQIDAAHNEGIHAVSYTHLTLPTN